jgi:hypothetical protein
MKTNHTLLIVAMAAIISCNKDKTTSPSTAVASDPMSEFFSSHEQQFQVFSLDAVQGGAITGSKGIHFVFSPNSFVTSAGQPVSGIVQIKLKEFITKSDLVLNRMYTVADGRPLQSGGAFEIHVLQNSAELKIAPGISYTLEMPPAPAQPQMFLYNGATANAQYGKVNWVLNSGTSNSFTQQAFDSTFFKQVLHLKELQYINCDHPYDSLFADLKVTLPQADNAYLMVVDRNSLMAIGILCSVASFQWAYAPTGKQLRIISIIRKDNKYYLSTNDVLFSGQSVILPPYTEKSENEISDAIFAL